MPKRDPTNSTPSSTPGVVLRRLSRPGDGGPGPNCTGPAKRQPATESTAESPGHPTQLRRRSFHGVSRRSLRRARGSRALAPQSSCEHLIGTTGDRLGGTCVAVEQPAVRDVSPHNMPAAPSASRMSRTLRPVSVPVILPAISGRVDRLPSCSPPRRRQPDDRAVDVKPSDVEDRITSASGRKRELRRRLTGDRSRDEKPSAAASRSACSPTGTVRSAS